MDIYYKSVDFKMIDGTATLLREYGPAHIMYPITLGIYIFDPKLVPIFLSCRDELEEYYNNNDH